MESIFENRVDLFYKDGEIKSSIFGWFVSELSEMKKEFNLGNKDLALKHEQNCMWAIYFADHGDVINDMEYELYAASDYTQLKHPRRTPTIKKYD